MQAHSDYITEWGLDQLTKNDVWFNFENIKLINNIIEMDNKNKGLPAGVNGA